jgi:hypothetical protein
MGNMTKGRKDIISTHFSFYNHRLQEVGRMTNYSTNRCDT